MFLTENTRIVVEKEDKIKKGIAGGEATNYSDYAVCYCGTYATGLGFDYNLVWFEFSNLDLEMRMGL